MELIVSGVPPLKMEIIVNDGCSARCGGIASGEADIVVYMGNHGCKHVVDAIKRRHNQVVVLPGPEDEAHIVRELAEKGVNIDGRVREFKGMRIAGIGGVDPVTSTRKLEEAIKSSGSTVDVLLAYYPPAHTGYIGSRGTLLTWRIMMLAKPRAVVSLTEKDVLVIIYKDMRGQYIISALGNYQYWTIMMELDENNRGSLVNMVKRDRVFDCVKRKDGGSN